VSRNLRHYPSTCRLDNILVRNGANSTLVKNNDLKVEGAAVAADFPTPNLSLICLLRPLMRLQWSRKNYRDAISVMTAENIFWSEGHVTREQRWARNGHKGCVVWLTGLPGAGKSTLSRVIERELFARGLNAFVLDGDNLRHGLNSNLGFSPPDRTENIRRTAEVGSLLASAGHVAIIALISPYRLDRLAAREIARAGGCGFVEVFVDAPLQICEQRDPKDLYRRARAGEIRNLTGIDAPYQPPENPEIHVRTDELSVEACLELILESLLPRLGLERP
jgi:adenylyl-sulfate kinase